MNHQRLNFGKGNIAIYPKEEINTNNAFLKMHLVLFLEDILNEILKYIDIKSVELYMMKAACPVWRWMICKRFNDEKSWKRITAMSIVGRDEMMSLVEGPHRILPVMNDLMPLLIASIKHGNRRNMKILFKRINPLSSSPGSVTLTNLAATVGNLEALKWLCKNNCLFNNEALNSAARNGHLSVVLWLHGEGSDIGSETMEEAAEGGHINIVKWLCRNACRTNSSVFDLAAFSGNMELLEYLLQIQCPKSSAAIGYAAKAGNIEVMKWLHQNGFQIDGLTVHIACEGNSIDAFKLLFRFGCPNTDKYAICRAAKRGNLGIMKLLRKNGFEWLSNIRSSEYSDAAYSGNVETLQWLKENGCPIVARNKSRALGSAAGEGKLGAMIWLLDNGWKLTWSTLYMSIWNCHHEIMVWLLERSCPGYKRATQLAVGCSNMDALRWLVNHGYKLTASCFDYAVVGNGTEMLDYLLQNKCPWNQSVFTAGFGSGRIETMQWLVDNLIPCHFNFDMIRGFIRHRNYSRKRSSERMQWILDPARPWFNRQSRNRICKK